MAKAGNFSQLDAVHEQAFYADAIAQLARAVHKVVATREALTRLLGLWGTNTAFKLTERLSDLPKAPNEATDIEAQAMEQRLDVLMAKRDAEATASALGLTRITRFVNVLDAGYINKSQSGAPRAGGYEISIELPLFDWGDARQRKAELYMASVSHAYEWNGDMPAAPAAPKAATADRSAPGIELDMRKPQRHNHH
jgi:outer membrane protein TolC